MNFCYSCMQQLDQHSESESCPYCGEPLHISCDASRYLVPGSILQEKFIVGKSLGSGGFGNTYIGWNQVLKCRVAIKEYFPGKLTSRGDDGVTVSVTDSVSQQRFRAGLHQFLEEARNIASLQDVKGVVQVYTFFEENGTGYIIMEYLDGMSVRDIINKKRETLDYSWSRDVVLTVLHTLREIHKRGILHRDIAPDNILVTKEGVIKLIDFGAAKNAAAVSNTYGEIVLKNGYAPIEQYSRHTKQGPYTDLYAVAALFYYMLCGVKPPAANERVQSDTLKPLSEMGVSVPEETELAIMVCLNIQAEYRMQSAQEFMEALGGEDFVPVYEPGNLLISADDDTSKKTFKTWFSGMKTWQRAGMVFGVLAFLGGAAFLGKMVSAALFPEDTAVVQVENQKLPDYLGQNLEKVQQELKDAGLEGEIFYHYQAERTEDTVVNEEPPAGSFAKSGDVISLTVESSEWVTLPDYEGWEKTDIEKSLKERLSSIYQKEVFQYQYSSVCQKEQCIEQTAEGKVSVRDAEELKVWISWGERSDYEKKMPDLKGKTVEQAAGILKDAGLEIKLVTEKAYSKEYASGQIFRQEISKGKLINTNIADKKNYSVPEKMEVTVSMGVKPTPTPVPTQRPVQSRTPATTPVPNRATKKPASNKNDNSVDWDWEW